MTTLGDCVDLVIFVGAAYAEAGPDQFARLRAEIPRMLDAYRARQIEEQDIKTRIQEIMGPDWTPSIEWRCA